MHSVYLEPVKVYAVVMDLTERGRSKEAGRRAVERCSRVEKASYHTETRALKYM